jgi:hypothetical protein
MEPVGTQGAGRDLRPVDAPRACEALVASRHENHPMHGGIMTIRNALFCTCLLAIAGAGACETSPSPGPGSDKNDAASALRALETDGSDASFDGDDASFDGDNASFDGDNASFDGDASFEGDDASFDGDASFEGDDASFEGGDGSSEGGACVSPQGGPCGGFVIHPCTCASGSKCVPDPIPDKPGTCAVCDPVTCPPGEVWDALHCACIMPCVTAAECHGALPAVCERCASGVPSCAHWACTAGRCQIAICP